MMVDSYSVKRVLMCNKVQPGLNGGDHDTGYSMMNSTGRG